MERGLKRAFTVFTQVCSSLLLGAINNVSFKHIFSYKNIEKAFYSTENILKHK